jgi:hypothetical protein
MPCTVRADIFFVALLKEPARVTTAMLAETMQSTGHAGRYIKTAAEMLAALWEREDVRADDFWRRVAAGLHDASGVHRLGGRGGSDDHSDGAGEEESSGGMMRKLPCKALSHPLAGFACLSLYDVTKKEDLEEWKAFSTSMEVPQGRSLSSFASFRAAGGIYEYLQTLSADA